MFSSCFVPEIINISDIVVTDCLKRFAMQTNIGKIIKGSCSQFYRSVGKSSNANSIQP